jgi:hypothetical protein
MAVSLPANQQLASPPIHILKLDRADLPSAQPQPDQQQQDRVITPADHPPPVTARQQPGDHRRLQAPRQRAVPQIRDRGQRPHQRRLDQPRHIQIPKQRPQALDQLPRAGNVAPRALACEKPAHVRGRQPVKLKPDRPLLEEHPREALVTNDRRARQAALDQQILAIALKQHLHRPVRDRRHRRRHRPDLAQILKRQRHAPRRDPRPQPSPTTHRQEQPSTLLIQITGAQSLTPKPATQNREQTQPLTNRPPRETPPQQPVLKPSRPRRQRPADQARTNPSTHRCLLSNRRNRTQEDSTDPSRLCRPAHHHNPSISRE